MKNVNENGRSMVEMLGVLAIIGVLSVGGIAGYTRAMNNWKANEIIDAMNRVAVAAETDMLPGQNGTTYTSLGSTPGNIAGGLVSEITGVRNGDGTVTVTVSWVQNAANANVMTAIREKLNCDGANDGACHLGGANSTYLAAGIGGPAANNNNNNNNNNDNPDPEVGGDG